MSGERALVNAAAMISREHTVLIKQYSRVITSSPLFLFSFMAAGLCFVMLELNNCNKTRDPL